MSRCRGPGIQRFGDLEAHVEIQRYRDVEKRGREI